MTILYALISRDKTVLVEHTIVSATGNFPTVTRMLLSKIPQSDGQMTYIYDEYIFHYILENGICYLCLSDDKNKHRLPYSFLQNVKELFLKQYGLEAAQKAIAFSFNEEFSTILSKRMDYYNSGGTIDSIDTVKNQIDEVRIGMVQNIEKVLERGEKIELLVDKTDRLNQQAFRFETSSRNLRRTMYWKRFRTMAMIGVFVVLVVFITSAYICGGFNFKRCRHS